MSHEITRTDGMVLVGKPAWHGLGHVLPEGTYTPREGLRIAGLDWEVRVSPILAQGNMGQLPVEDRRAIVREDTQTVLGIVSDGFCPVQNSEVVELLQSLGRPIESMGSLRGGRITFAVLRQGAFQLGAGDEVRQYLLAVNGHDGSRALSFMPTDIRVVCANTLRRAEAGSESVVRMLHTSGLSDRMAHASQALETAEAFVSTTRHESQLLFETPFLTAELAVLYRDTLHGLGIPDSIDVLPIGPDGFTARDESGIRGPIVDRARGLLAELESARAHPDNALPGMAGTGWQAYQGVSRWAQHVRAGRMDRLTSDLFGPVHEIKARAWKTSLAIAGGV